MLGKLLCRLGVHDSQLSGFNQNEYNHKIESTWGYCVRPECTFSWQLDNV